MFTGLVADKGTVTAVDATADGVRLAVRTALAPELSEGDSVAVNGVCLTATAIAGGRFTADVMHETLRRSSLAEVAEGAPVNLELPLRATDRLGGHVVQGHVDGVAALAERVPLPDGSTRMRFTVPDGLGRYVVEKGSITLDGISLTVAALHDDGLDVAVIPHTLAVTTLGSKQVGDPVNLEVDVLAKYVERLLPIGVRGDAQ